MHERVEEERKEGKKTSSETNTEYTNVCEVVLLCHALQPNVGKKINYSITFVITELQ